MDDQRRENGPDRATEVARGLDEATYLRLRVELEQSRDRAGGRRGRSGTSHPSSMRSHATAIPLTRSITAASHCTMSGLV